MIVTIVKNENIRVALEEGYVIWMKNSGPEKRYYKLNQKTKELQWSDNSYKWNTSKLTIEDLMEHEFIKIGFK